MDIDEFGAPPSDIEDEGFRFVESVLDTEIAVPSFPIPIQNVDGIPKGFDQEAKHLLLVRRVSDGRSGHAPNGVRLVEGDPAAEISEGSAGAINGVGGDDEAWIHAGGDAGGIFVSGDGPEVVPADGEDFETH